MTSTFLSLPVELLLDISRLALVESRPSVLSTVCKDFTNVVNAALYHTVTLDNARRSALFLQTTKSHLRLLQNIRHLVVTADDLKQQSWAAIWCMLPQASGLLSLTLEDGSQVKQLASFLGERTLDFFSSITLREFSDVPSSPRSYIGSPLTRLRVCTPSDVWFSPSTILATFACPPQLTHLQLARRINGNEDNDAVFTAEIKGILETYPELRALTVSLYEPTWPTTTEEADVEASHIWGQLREIGDDRLKVVRGQYEDWMTSPWASECCV
ncbi:hypothetical protein CYLTODRAFT_420643 [Cylindrobasidium torrendii FP15055 ss-10]|uniref:Uncharacterized protein n=1 Tax=Cylindrobasidium torrendii FP15055 ss-10 TaxID=1314674 RepID=A0A0D7BFZ7_9AGAR|nr:hypothetical protein CYLTODRAFT_420643 [Cylindrobasidium torrendii FP15055 ss-10]